jgi:hypothetical protein
MIEIECLKGSSLQFIIDSFIHCLDESILKIVIEYKLKILKVFFFLFQVQGVSKIDIYRCKFPILSQFLDSEYLLNDTKIISVSKVSVVQVTSLT